MNPDPLTIDIVGMDRSEATLQALRSTLANREDLHAEMAVNVLEFTRQYLLATPRHNTAEKLGAKPTNFRARTVTLLSGASDEAGAILRIPRSTGLGRAFSDIVILPTGGRVFLALPETAETYGRQPSEWPDETFKFGSIFTHRGAAPVLVWAESGGNHKKGDIAFWLRRSVKQLQDRTLLPPDEEYIGLSRDTIIAHINNRIQHSAA